MTSTLNIHRDADDPSTPDDVGKRCTILSSSPTLSSTCRTLHELSTDIAHDRTLTQRMIDDVGRHIGFLRIGFGKQERSLISLLEPSHDADQIKILLEIERGEFRRYTQVEFLTDGAAKKLAEWTGTQNLLLDQLKELTDEQAELLAAFKGNSLSLGGLTTITQSQAISLATFQGRYLRLNGLETIRDPELEALMYSPCVNVSIGVPEFTDKQIGILGKFRGNVIALPRLKEISGPQALIFSLIAPHIDCPSESYLKIVQAGSTL